MPPSLHLFLFGVFPYVAVAIFALVTAQRMGSWGLRAKNATKHFAENGHHFWGNVPFHGGLLLVLGGHLAALLVPERILAWNAVPVRLYVLEVSGLALGLLVLVGLANVGIHRIATQSGRRATSACEWVLYALLLAQAFAGVYTAVTYRWGSSWFAAHAVPYLRSLLALEPDASYMGSLPLAVQLHVIGGFAILALFPFTRLTHVILLPNLFDWRKPQVVVLGREGAK